MKEQYTAPMAELIEISLSDSIALTKCGGLYRRTSYTDYGKENDIQWKIEKWNGIGDPHNDTANWTEVPPFVYIIFRNQEYWDAMEATGKGETDPIPDGISWDGSLNCFSS